MFKLSRMERQRVILSLLLGANSCLGSHFIYNSYGGDWRFYIIALILFGLGAAIDRSDAD